MRILRLLGATLAVAIIIFCVYFASLPEPEGFPILEYHKITDVDEIYSVPPDEFAAQLDYLKSEGYTTITPADYVKARNGEATLPDKPIILTFDDGYIDNYLNMMPILEQHGMKAVVYPVANYIGLEGYLSVAQLNEMKTRGIEIGSHTSDHIALAEFDASKKLYEIRDSKKFMEWKGVKNVVAFSYPNGYYDAECVDFLKQSGYSTAVTGDPGLNTLETNPYLLKRVHIRKPHFGVTEFRLRLFKAYFYAKMGW